RIRTVTKSVCEMSIEMNPLILTQMRTADRPAPPTSLPLPLFSSSGALATLAHLSSKTWTKKAARSPTAHSRYDHYRPATAPRQPQASPTDSLRSWFETAKAFRHHERAKLSRTTSLTPLIPRAFSGLRPDSSRAPAPPGP